MSFRNYAFSEQQNIKIEQQGPSELFLSSKFPAKTVIQPPNNEVLSKITDVIVSMHESCLNKCQNIEIYRDLSSEEQELLIKADKNSVLHTALAGVLAVDSCLKALQKQEKHIIGNILRANSAVIASYKCLQTEHGSESSHSQLSKLSDAIKYLTQQLQTLPACKGRQAQFEKQLSVMDNQSKDEQWLGNDNALLSQLQKENEMLKLAIRQKDGYINSLQGQVDRNSKMERKQDRRTSHTLRNRRPTEKSSENESQSQASLHQVYEELNKIRDELNEKNTIILKMNDEFSSEMQKYNSVFKRLQEQNRTLRKYNDIDTIYMLGQLQAEIQSLKEQRYKDQMIIGDIQRRFEGMSFGKTNQLRTENVQHVRSHQYLPQHYDNSYQPPYQPRHMQYSPRQMPYREPHYLHAGRQRIASKYYSPNYNSRISPYDRPPTYREEAPFLPETGRSRLTRRDGGNRSRLKYGNIHSSRERQSIEPKSNASINLLERVMARGV